MDVGDRATVVVPAFGFQSSDRCSAVTLRRVVSAAGDPRAVNRPFTKAKRGAEYTRSNLSLSTLSAKKRVGVKHKRRPLLLLLLFNCNLLTFARRRANLAIPRQSKRHTKSLVPMKRPAVTDRSA